MKLQSSRFDCPLPQSNSGANTTVVSSPTAGERERYLWGRKCLDFSLFCGWRSRRRCRPHGTAKPHKDPTLVDELQGLTTGEANFHLFHMLHQRLATIYRTLRASQHRINNVQ